jgi:transcriptional regulator with XRE-family HTH domain
MRTNLPRAVRALRLRQGLTQAALAERTGVSRELVSRLERSDFEGMTFRALSLIAEGLGGHLDVQLLWRGARLDRLLDAAHAAIQEAVARQLIAWGWIVHAEVSFNHYGDRGRVDLLAYAPGVRMLMVVEVKSVIGDVQDTIGRLHVKSRLGSVIAREVGIGSVTAVVPTLVIGDSRAARRIVARHESLLNSFAGRGRQARSWVRRPSSPAPSGLLWFVERSKSHQTDTRALKRAP